MRFISQQHWFITS